MSIATLLLILSNTGHAETTRAPRTGQQAVNADAGAMAAFSERVEAYVALHRRIRDALDRLPDKATPAEIDAHQRQFAARMGEARSSAQPGDLFSPDVQVVIRGLMERLFDTQDARLGLRESIMDDNPAGQIKLAVNARYPDDVPLSSMPPSVLKNLPKLPEELQYRFVGEFLILLDSAPHLVVDFMPGALPR